MRGSSSTPLLIPIIAELHLFHIIFVGNLCTILTSANPHIQCEHITSTFPSSSYSSMSSKMKLHVPLSHVKMYPTRTSTSHTLTYVKSEDDISPIEMLIYRHIFVHTHITGYFIKPHVNTYSIYTHLCAYQHALNIHMHKHSQLFYTSHICTYQHDIHAYIRTHSADSAVVGQMVPTIPRPWVGIT